MCSRFRLLPLLAVIVALTASPVQAAESVQLVSTEYPPYMGAALPNGGITVDIVTRAFRRAGYEPTVTFRPWARALDEARDGQYDGVVFVWRNAEREKWLAFSGPLPTNQIGLYKLKADRIVFRTLADLAPYSIGVGRGYVNPPAFEAAGLQTQSALDDEENLRKLDAHRVDMVLIDRGVAAYLLGGSLAKFAGEMEWVDPPIEEQVQYLGMPLARAGYQVKLDAFNRALASLHADGTVKALEAELGY
ncbi:MAG TPA: transporter substrate-binding domain-containing protein [Aliidongia sp.]|uniref:substrate-binding periplasmic protein n=1 Tax=Aliidongia sp. TaxID=1914230 RepID=UPI002DDD2691|nr:transporter substrate-binding domain-containing protein [Aliidongia sp.]HEV2674472.1 transporter substrate-binding domain-containing protein [Aliidongia sp.]